MNSSTAMNSPLVGNARPEKALWYQEVLSLDPDSRIFLPYARLLAELGRENEAADVLKAGLTRHPEFLEARLFLIELLYASGHEAAASLEAGPILEQLSHCPVLWRIWSRRPDLRADQAAMMLFFAESMQKGGISLADVFEAGMASLEGASAHICREAPAEASLPAQPEPLPVPTAPVPSAIPASEPQEAQTAAAQAFVMADDAPWYSLDAVPEDDDIYDDEPESAVSVLTALTTPVLMPANETADGESVNDAAPVLPAHKKDTAPALPAQDDIERIPAMSPVPRGTLEGKSSLCTRSMARILEEQGAADEAADIYRELLENCASDEEREELNAKLASILQGTDSAAPAQQPSSGILDMLETLADRLEKRSRV